VDGRDNGVAADFVGGPDPAMTAWIGQRLWPLRLNRKERSRD